MEQYFINCGNFGTQIYVYVIGFEMHSEILDTKFFHNPVSNI